jgi:large subunit ribosomal protein L35
MARSKSSRKNRTRSSRVKLKTQKTAAKRVKRTGTGKLRVRHAYKGHLLTRKPSRRLRRLRKPGFVSSADRQNFERLVPPSS